MAGWTASFPHPSKAKELLRDRNQPVTPGLAGPTAVRTHNRQPGEGFRPKADDVFIELCIRNFMHRGQPMLSNFHPSSLESGQRAVSYYAAAVMGGLTHMSENVREGSKATFDQLWTDVTKFLTRDQACNLDIVFAYIQATVMLQTCALLLGDDKYMSEITDTH